MMTSDSSLFLEQALPLTALLPTGCFESWGTDELGTISLVVVLGVGTFGICFRTMHAKGG